MYVAKTKCVFREAKSLSNRLGHIVCRNTELIFHFSLIFTVRQSAKIANCRIPGAYHFTCRVVSAAFAAKTCLNRLHRINNPDAYIFERLYFFLCCVIVTHTDPWEIELRDITIFPVLAGSRLRTKRLRSQAMRGGGDFEYWIQQALDLTNWRQFLCVCPVMWIQ